MISGYKLARAWLLSCLFGTVFATIAFWSFSESHIELYEVVIGMFFTIPISIIFSTPYFLVNLVIVRGDQDFSTKEKYLSYCHFLFLLAINFLVLIKEGNETAIYSIMLFLCYALAGIISYLAILRVRLYKFI